MTIKRWWFRNKRAQLEIDYSVDIPLVLLGIVIVVASYILLKPTLSGMVNYIKNMISSLFGFGG